MPRSEFRRILEAVRNLILEWALKLEQEGIMGEGLTFSPEDQRKAESVTNNYFHGPFTGIAGGSVTANNINIAANSLSESLARVPEPARDEIKRILDELTAADEQKKATLRQRAKEWLEKYGPMVGPTVDVIRTLVGL
jgi:hypothetical protein